MIFYFDEQDTKFWHDFFFTEKFTCILHFRAFKQMQCREKRWDEADTVLTAQWRIWSFNETLFHFTLRS